MVVLRRVLILGIPTGLAGALAGMVAVTAGLTGRSYELAEAAAVVVAGPPILLFVDRFGRSRDDD